MFGFFKKRNSINSPDELISEIIRLLEKKKMDELVGLCNEHYDVIQNNFKAWSKVPDHIRATPEKLEQYANALISLAEMFRQSGDESLINILQGNPDDNPIEIWQTKIGHAMELSEMGRLIESKEILLSVIPELEQSTGNARNDFLPKAYGHLGVISLHLEDMDGAIGNTHKALGLSREIGDIEGVAAYAGNLVEIMCRTGLVEKDHLLVKERIAALIQLGRADEAADYAANFSRY